MTLHVPSDPSLHDDAPRSSDLDGQDASAEGPHSADSDAATSQSSQEPQDPSVPQSSSSNTDTEIGLTAAITPTAATDNNGEKDLTPPTDTAPVSAQASGDAEDSAEISPDPSAPPATTDEHQVQGQGLDNGNTHQTAQKTTETSGVTDAADGTVANVAKASTAQEEPVSSAAQEPEGEGPEEQAGDDADLALSSASNGSTDVIQPTEPAPPVSTKKSKHFPPYRVRKSRRQSRLSKRLHAVSKDSPEVRLHHKVALHNARISARKARLVVDMIRGLSLHEALSLMPLTHKKAAVMVSKLLVSAHHNLQGLGIESTTSTVVMAAYVNEGQTWKRWRCRAQGRSASIRKRTCSIVIELAVLSASSHATGTHH